MSEEEGMTLTTGHLMCENMKEYLLGRCRYHETNVKLYFQNPVGIGDHPDILGAIESELQKLAEYKEKLEVLRQIERGLW